jgi:hypothetical protein
VSSPRSRCTQGYASGKVVAELMGRARLDTTRSYTLPTADDREAAVNAIPSDR